MTLAVETSSPNLAIIYISLAPLPLKPILPPGYQPSAMFFQSLPCQYPYTTHAFHDFNPKFKRLYAMHPHSLLHYTCYSEKYCQYHNQN
jgi:hypothetical protein